MSDDTGGEDETNTPQQAVRTAPNEDRSEIGRLERELDQLRRRYPIGREYRYRRIAIGLAIIGIGTYLMSWIYPETRELLLLLGGTGLFTAVLVFYLTPDRFVPASLSERIFTPLLRNHQDLIDEFELEGPTIYVPVRSSGGASDGTRVMLYLPKSENYQIPVTNLLEERMIVTGDDHHRGLSVRPSASDLVRDFANGQPTGLNSNPTQLAPQLIDGLTNSLELIDSGTEEVFPTENRMEIRLTNPYFLHLDGFDNPIVSFIGTGLAAGLDTPIDLRVRPSTEDEIGDYVLTCDW